MGRDMERVEFIQFLDKMSQGELQDYLEDVWRGEVTLTEWEENQLVDRIRRLKVEDIAKYTMVFLVLLAIAQIDAEKKTPITAIFNSMDEPEIDGEWDYMWVTKGDDKVCPICSPLDGKILGVDFTLRPKLHPGCRCELKKVPKVRRAMHKIGVLEAGSIRAVKDGKKRILEVLAAPFGSPSRKDRLNQYLSARTDYMIEVGDKRPLLYYHGFTPRGRRMKSPPKIGRATVSKIDDAGLWMRAELIKEGKSELADRTWSAALEGKARASTGSVNYLEDHDESTGEVYCWPIAELSVFDGSDERVPVSDDALVIPLRALFKESEIDLPDYFEAGEDKGDEVEQNSIDKRNLEMEKKEVEKQVAEILAAKEQE